jgi:hypothetical protein
MAKPELRLSTDVDTMPLVRVSIEHGTTGLEQRLQTALARVGLDDTELIQASINLGPDIHSGDRRTYEPYSGHLLRTPIRLIEQFGVTDPVVIAAAPLHDTIEDHPDELIRRFLDEPIPMDSAKKRDLARRALRAFAIQYDAADLADIVWDVSTPPRPRGVPKIPAYLGHTAHILTNSDPRSAVLKNADFTDNTDTPIELEKPHKREYLDLKQIGAYALHIAAIEREDSLVPPEFREEAIALLTQKEAEAHARLRARGVLDVTSAVRSLRTA